MATKIYNSLDDLKKDSIACSVLTTTVWSLLQDEEASQWTYATKFNGCYAVNNSTLAYVHENLLYITPYTRAAIRILTVCGFEKEEFFVPYSDGDSFPKVKESQWKKLLKMANKQYEEEFLEDCATYCDVHDIGKIDSRILKNCFVIPKNGIKIKTPFYEDMYYPIISESMFNAESIDKLGKYFSNNGRVVFVYRDGKTYVTKGYKIIDYLEAAGYRESGLFVPFSNGETIIDPNLAKKWNKIVKNGF